MLTSAQDCSGSGSTWIVPENVPKRPVTLEIMRCRTWKPIDEWTGSMVRIPGAGTGIPSTVLVASSTIMGALLSGGEGLWRLVANVWWRRNSLQRGGAAPLTGAGT